MMKKVFTGFLAGAAAGIVISTAGFMTDVTNLFLLAMVILAVSAFVPLIVKVLKDDRAPNPTVYGTSAPGKFTTVGMKGREKDKGNSSLSSGKATVSAGAGAALLISFFVSVVIYL